MQVRSHRATESIPRCLGAAPAHANWVPRACFGVACVHNPTRTCRLATLSGTSLAGSTDAVVDVYRGTRSRDTLQDVHMRVDTWCLTPRDESLNIPQLPGALLAGGKAVGVSSPDAAGLRADVFLNFCRQAHGAVPVLLGLHWGGPPSMLLGVLPFAAAFVC